MKDLKEITKTRDIDFSEIVKAMCDHINENWDIGDLSHLVPKGFLEYDEPVYDSTEEERLCESFKGFNDQTDGSQNFPNSVSKFHVKISEDNGQTPIECLVGAILHQGMVIGERKHQLETLELFKGVSQSIICETKYSKIIGDVKFDRIERELEFFKNQINS